MEPEDPKPQQPEADTAEKRQVEGEKAEPEPSAVESRVEPVAIVRPSMAQREFGRVSRRELLKVAPVLALGAFAIPGAQEWLLKKGLGFSAAVPPWTLGADVRRCGIDAVREVSHQRLRRG